MAVRSSPRLTKSLTQAAKTGEHRFWTFLVQYSSFKRMKKTNIEHRPRNVERRSSQPHSPLGKRNQPACAWAIEERTAARGPVLASRVCSSRLPLPAEEEERRRRRSTIFNTRRNLYRPSWYPLKLTAQKTAAPSALLCVHPHLNT